MKLRNYVLVTAGYWAFTLTDGALRMLVLLYFHELGYSPVAIAFLFLLYEFMGIVTNLIGGWVGARTGLNRTLLVGLGLQVVALVGLTFHDPSWVEWMSVAFVMGLQALSGVAKDLTKMSSKSAVKFMAGEGALFRLVAILTGSKNALKGFGFFVGAVLLAWIGYDAALWSMAVMITVVLIAVGVLLDEDIGRAKVKPPLRTILSKSTAINRLSAARFFLFGSRDIWFVVALPIFLDEVLGWSFEQIGAFLAAWLIGYGIVQSFAPRLLATLDRQRRRRDRRGAHLGVRTGHRVGVDGGRCGTRRCRHRSRRRWVDRVRRGVRDQLVTALVSDLGVFGRGRRVARCRLLLLRQRGRTPGRHPPVRCALSLGRPRRRALGIGCVRRHHVAAHAETAAAHVRRRARAGHVGNRSVRSALTSERSDAGMQDGESVGVDAVAGAGAFDLALDQAGLAQDPQVLGDGRLCEWELATTSPVVQVSRCASRRRIAIRAGWAIALAIAASVSSSGTSTESGMVGGVQHSVGSALGTAAAVATGRGRGGCRGRGHRGAPASAVRSG